ncbi:hypothetical protein EYF80_026074 [Liparis tanakae]|uniref:Uncharacterized protein n=1 Tax=Liparis tanakae TaxID=230148 RepID=A0A4Z2HD11_9TELE|nr:hypothetical protein EYF80_026074 [Liparis tanakae]
MSPVVDLSGGTATKCDVLWVDQLAKAQQVLAHFHLDPALPTPHSNAVVSLWLPQFKVDRGLLHRIHWIFWKPPGQRVVHRLHLLSPEHGSLPSRLPGGPSLRRCCCCCCCRLNFNSQLISLLIEMRCASRQRVSAAAASRSAARVIPSVRFVE